MESLRIDRLDARYRLPPSRAAERGRLDRALRRMLDEAVDGALESAGLGKNEEVCIRDLHVPVRLRLSAAEDQMVQDWSAALGRSLSEAVREGKTGQVVRYGSRIHALVDLGTGAATGDLRRAWAWNQLGLGPVHESSTPAAAARALAAALAWEPEAIVPVLRTLAASGQLARLLALLPEKVWTELAEQALHAAGAATEVRPEPVQVPDPPAAIRRAIQSSPIGRLLLRSLAPGHPLRSALIALALLDADPGSVRNPATLQALRALQAADPESLQSPQSPEATDQKGRASEVPHTESARTENLETVQEVQDALAPELLQDLPLPDLRRTGETRLGGLLFLLGLLEDLGLPEEIGLASTTTGRSFRWTLHLLALTLTSAAPDDPAVLAFTGLLPDEPPPSQDEDPPSPEERETCAAWSERIAAELRVRLRREDEHSAAVLDRLCRRHARIVADPGWIEAHLSLDEVSMDVRRAGLDLDPGWISWLGVALRFVYE